MTKICTSCGQEKDLNQFRNQANGRFGKKSYCIECDDKYNKNLYLKNKKNRINQISNWNKKNPEKVKVYRKNWRDKKKIEDLDAKNK